MSAGGVDQSFLKKTAVCSGCGHRCCSRDDKRPCRARDLRVACWTLHVEFWRRRVGWPGCGGVYLERLDGLAKNPRYTERFALHVGNLCWSMTQTAVAELERLHDGTVKDLSRLYMAEQGRRAGTPAPRAIGIDEIAIHNGHDYRVGVSDLEGGRPIWFGGSWRTEPDIDQFFVEVGQNAVPASRWR